MTGQNTAEKGASGVPLAQILRAVVPVLSGLRNQTTATESLARVDGALRPAAQAICYAVLRQWGQSLALRRRLAPRAPAPDVDALLRAALALLAEPLPPGGKPRYAEFTVVDQAVAAARAEPKLRASAGFINAVLRRFLRERDIRLAATAEEPEARWNHPAWWVERLRHDHPRQWEALLDASRRAAPMHLRVNRRRTTRQAYLHLLQCAGLPAHAFGEDGLRLERACDVAELPGFAEGWVSVQDAAAQLAAPLLLGAFEAPVGRPARVLDACAAPGGKTAHLLERADLALTALDLSARRSARIHANLSRLGLAADVRTADAGDSAAYWDGKPWDAILLDAPCSASGIVRRHPDVPWLRREADVTTIAAVQQRLLTVLWPQLAPGGALLYATCSVFREEGEQSIKTFLAHNTDAQLLRAPGHLLPGIPEGHGAVPDNRSGDHDGFYYALLRKRLA